MAEEPPCFYVLSAETNDPGIKDCSSARRNLLNRSTSGPFAFASKSLDRGATVSSLSNSNRTNFEDHTEWVESTGPETNGPVGE